MSDKRGSSAPDGDDREVTPGPARPRADSEVTEPSDKEITVVTESLERRAQGGGPACLVVFYGADIGRRHSLDKTELIIGRANTANLSIDHNSVSRQHAKILSTDGKSRIFDLGSTNGTFVNDERVDESELRNGDLVRIGNVIFKYLSGADIEAKYHEEIYRLTTIDGLTNAFNKRYFVEALERELNRALRYRRLLSLVLFDIDHFKRVNDTFGHLAGDHILRELAHLVADNLRREDIFARYGGEEFAIILPENDGPGATMVCEKLRRLAEERHFGFDGQEIRVTISLGIATLGPDASLDMEAQDFIAAADGRLYAAKQGGRNRVCA